MPNAKIISTQSATLLPPLASSPRVLWLFVVFATVAAGSRLSYPAMPGEIDSVFGWQTGLTCRIRNVN